MNLKRKHIPFQYDEGLVSIPLVNLEKLSVCLEAMKSLETHFSSQS